MVCFPPRDAMVRAMCQRHNEQFVLPRVEELEQTAGGLQEQVKAMAQAQQVLKQQLEDHRAAALQAQQTLQQQLDEHCAALQKAHEELKQQVQEQQSVTYKATVQTPRSQGSGDGMPNLVRRVQELAVAVERKADSAGVVTHAQLHRQLCSLDRAGGGPTGGAGRDRSSSMSRRLEELAASLERKADVGFFASKADLDKLAMVVHSKVNIEDAASRRELLELGSQLGAKLDLGAAPTHLQVQHLFGRIEARMSVEVLPALAKAEELVAALDRKVDASMGSLPDTVEKQVAETMACFPGSFSKQAAPKDVETSADVKKVKVVVAAAGARLEKQISDLKRQVHDLKAQVVASAPAPDAAAPADEGQASALRGRSGKGAAAEEPPTGATGGTGSEPEGSDLASRRSESIAGSALSSMTGFGQAEREELRRVQAVVGAAGTAFSKEMKELRKALRDHREEHKKEMLAMKNQLAMMPPPEME